jgi:hypothetical protein
MRKLAQQKIPATENATPRARPVAPEPMLGNQARLRQLSTPRIQAKLEVGAVDDPLEREADAVADRVMRMPDPGLDVSASPAQVSRKCDECEDKPSILRAESASASHSGSKAAPDSVKHVLQSGGGRPLTQAQTGFFGTRLGRDLSNVRIHTGTHAAASARAIDALAYTVGPDIVFGDGAWQPDTAAGLHLLAHELVHVVQQGGHARPASQHTVGEPGTALEREADRGADTLARGGDLSGRIARAPSTSGSAVVQRAVSKVCNPPSVWFALAAASNPALVPNAILSASLFGAIAETFISADVIKSLAVAPGNFYFDNPLAGPIDPAYVSFIIGKNPGLSLLQKAAIAASMVVRPDVLMHQASNTDFEEVKPNSTAGRAAGRVKVGGLNSFYSSFALPYVAGATYTPRAPFTVFTGVVAGIPITITFEISRDRNGLLVYDICVETDWLKVSVLAIAAAAIVIIALILAGTVGPVAAPAVAALASNDQGGAPGPEGGAPGTEGATATAAADPAPQTGAPAEGASAAA